MLSGSSRVSQWLRAWASGQDPAAAVEEPAAPPPIDTIRCAMVRAMRGCSDRHRAHAAEQVMGAGGAMELWLLRGDLYQYLARDLGQAEAERRVAGLQPLFQGHVARARRSEPAAAQRAGLH